MAATAWSLTGNSGTNPGTNFLGTTDNQPLVINTAGSERFRVDPSGNIGIANPAPAHPLHLSTGKQLRIEGGTGPGDTANYFSFGGNGAFGVDALDSPNGRFVILDSGNVGVGWSTPISKFHVYAPPIPLNTNMLPLEADAVATPAPLPGPALPISAMTIDVQTFTSALNAQASHFFRVRDIGAAPPNGLTQFIILGNGNVGIGTDSPTSKLQVAGDISVSGDVLLTGADCAEQFDTVGAQPPDPGTVVVIDHEGALRESSEPYDKKVAGVVSGAGEYKHALMLDKRALDEGRVPVALMGKVFCKVDARYSPIEVGDLLTTSPTPGHAMKASESAKAFGSCLGKALRSLRQGQGLIPILVTLQ